MVHYNRMLNMGIIAFMIALVALSGAAAETDGSEADAGLTPENPFWGVDVAFDRIRLALETNPDRKAERALAIAEERLSEIRETAGNERATARAREQHDRFLSALESQVGEIEDADAVEELERRTRIEQRLVAHRARVENLTVSVEGNLTEEQQAALDALVASLADRVGEVEIEIESRKERVRDRIRAELGNDADDVISGVEGDVWEQRTVVAQRNAEREIVKTEERIARFEQRRAERLAEALGEDDYEDDYDGYDDESEDESDDEYDDSSDDASEEDSDDASETDGSDDSADNLVTGQVTDDGSDDGSDDASENADDGTENESEDETEGESEDRSDDDYDDDSEESDAFSQSLLAEFGFEVPNPDARGVEVSLSLLEEARSALETSYNRSENGEYRAAYAYAKFARRVADRAGSGKYLTLTDREEAELDRLEEEREAAEERAEEMRERMEEEREAAEERRDRLQEERRERAEEEREAAEERAEEEREAAEEEEERLEDDADDETDDSEDDADDTESDETRE